MYENPKYTEDLVTIEVVLAANGRGVLLSPDHVDYGNVVAGDYGEVEPFTPYSQPNYQTATKLSVMRYLKSTGQWAAIKAALIADEDMYDEWLVSSELLITDPTVQVMKALMEWTDEQLQDLFNTVNA